MTANTSGVAKKPLYKADGSKYFRQEFEIVLLFGLTEMKALITWIEKVCIAIFIRFHETYWSFFRARVSRKGVVN